MTDSLRPIRRNFRPLLLLALVLLAGCRPERVMFEFSPTEKARTDVSQPVSVACQPESKAAAQSTTLGPVQAGSSSTSDDELGLRNASHLTDSPKPLSGRRAIKNTVPRTLSTRIN